MIGHGGVQTGTDRISREQYMFISRMEIRNWRNFQNADVELSDTVFLIGQNASGKSNFLDILRFMRDIVNPRGGGLQQAVASRGGMKKVRCLAARSQPDIELKFDLKNTYKETNSVWRYELGIRNEGSGQHRPMVKYERASQNGNSILDRPSKEDKADSERLTEAHIGLANLNREFRDIANFFNRTIYLHLIPQLLKYGEMFVTRQTESDPFGQGFLEQISKTQTNTRNSRLKRIEQILAGPIPGIRELKFVKDESKGTPHLEIVYEHWRPQGAKQREDQFSDGTLRLIALLWTLMESDNLILLEEPELSLHEQIIGQIPRMLDEARRSRKKANVQIFISTHSPTLLSDTSISGTFLVLIPGKNGEQTRIKEPTEKDTLAMQAGLSAADILLPKTFS